jgi:hypothetical protein
MRADIDYIALNVHIWMSNCYIAESLALDGSKYICPRHLPSFCSCINCSSSISRQQIRRAFARCPLFVCFNHKYTLAPTHVGIHNIAYSDSRLWGCDYTSMRTSIKKVEQSHHMCFLPLSLRSKLGFESGIRAPKYTKSDIYTEVTFRLLDPSIKPHPSWCNIKMSRLL